MPAVTVHRIGREPQPIVVIDDFARDRSALRAIAYPGLVLGSGPIGAGAALSPDPATGRLTVTGFFSIETQGALDVATP